MSDDYIGRKIFDSRIGISLGGRPYTDDEGVERISKKGITIKNTESKAPLKISARALLALYFLMKDDKEVRDTLRQFALEEKGNDREQEF